MLEAIFSGVLRNIAIPIVSVLILQSTPLGPKGAILAVAITLTVVNLISIVIQLIKIIPNLVLLKGDRIMYLIIRIIIEIGSAVGFWVYYFMNYV